MEKCMYYYIKRIIVCKQWDTTVFIWKNVEHVYQSLNCILILFFSIYHAVAVVPYSPSIFSANLTCIEWNLIVLRLFLSSSRGRNALRIMAHGFSSKVLKYPLHHLADQLWFDDSNACVSVCQFCGLQVQGQEWVVFLKTSFREPEKKVTTKVSFVY